MLIYMADTTIMSPKSSISTPAIPPVDCKIITIVIKLALTKATMRFLRGLPDKELLLLRIKWATQKAIKNSRTTGITSQPTLMVAGLVSIKNNPSAVTQRRRTFI